MAVIDVLGVLGGTTIAASLIPQVIKTFTSKSAGDISYVYQAIYIFGCTLTNIYAIALGLWPVYIPCLAEELMIISLTVMKIIYDRRDRRKEAEEATRKQQEEEQPENTASIRIPTEEDDDDEEEENDNNDEISCGDVEI